MAGSAIIGALRVVLGADTAAFETGLNKARASASSFAASVTKIAAGVGLEHGLEKAVESIVHGFKEAVKSADDMGKAAQKVGLPVEELTKLKFAADLSDVSLESLSAGLGKLSKNMAAVATGSKEQKDHFDALGITVTNADGTLRSVSDVFADLSGKFAESADGAAKTATALNLLGKGGKDLIPLLNEGKHGIEEMTQMAEKMGLVISQNTANASQKFNDNLKILSLTQRGLTNLIMEGLLPALVRLSEEFVNVVKEGDKVRAMATFIVDAIKGTVAWFSAQAVAAQQTGRALSELWQGLVALGDNFEKANEHFAEMNRINEETPAKMDAAAAAVNRYFTAITVTGKALKGMPLGENNDAIAKFIEATTKSIAVMNAERDAVGAAAGEKERLRIINEGLAIAEANHIPITEALILRLREQGNAAAEAALKLEGMHLKFANLDPFVQYQMAMANTEIAMRSVGATAEEIARAQEKAGEKFGMTWSAIGSNIAGTAGALSQLTGTFAKENKAMGIASKAFGISQAIINTAIGVTKAFATLPPPASYVAAALAVATGAAQIATISAQSFAKGGSFMVPGGMSGTDNMMVPLNLASGERVDITSANEASRGGFGGDVAEVKIGMGMRDFLMGDNLRELVDTLNIMRPDGYRLSFAD
jgi:hypothetical protein